MSIGVDTSSKWQNLDTRTPPKHLWGGAVTAGLFLETHLYTKHRINGQTDFSFQLSFWQTALPSEMETSQYVLMHCESLPKKDRRWSTFHGWIGEEPCQGRCLRACGAWSNHTWTFALTWSLSEKVPDNTTFFYDYLILFFWRDINWPTERLWI